MKIQIIGGKQTFPPTIWFFYWRWRWWDLNPGYLLRYFLLYLANAKLDILVVNSRLKKYPYSLELNYSFSQVQKELGGFTVLWTIFAAFFGIVVTDPNNSKSKSGKFLLMIFLFCGRGFFFAYLAFLTSSLAFPNEFLAFTSPQEILNTNYR